MSATPEQNRATVSVKLRLRAEVKRALEALAAADALTVSDWVAERVSRALSREPLQRIRVSDRTRELARIRAERESARRTRG